MIYPGVVYDMYSGVYDIYWGLLGYVLVSFVKCTGFVYVMSSSLYFIRAIYSTGMRFAWHVQLCEGKGKVKCRVCV